jgi:hypothetical protein
VGDLVTSFDERALQALSATFDQLAEQGLLTPVVTLDRLRAALSPSQLLPAHDREQGGDRHRP